MARNTLGQTPSQTVGPFFAYGLTPEQYGYDFRAIASRALAGEAADGEHVHLVGRVLDGEGIPVKDALIEIWQADARGVYPHPTPPAEADAAFTGFGRCGTGTDAEVRFRFDTIKPGTPSSAEAPHINVVVFMRGLLKQVVTRIYFDDEEDANARDPVLTRIPAERRHTLIAQRRQTPAGIFYHHDIRMQGEDETVFFEV